ncbi:30S ribosomal protein S20 [Candidatus Uhrbacteria bacterium]|nr:30S ribosomal protein S20 [Candidatus Uhrbacteria bacterium]
MPNLQNAKKALRQSVKHAARNKIVAEELHSLRRNLRKALTGKDAAKAKELAKTLVQKFDKAAKKGIIKKQTAGRLKSRMAQALRALP